MDRMSTLIFTVSVSVILCLKNDVHNILVHTRVKFFMVVCRMERNFYFFFEVDFGRDFFGGMGFEVDVGRDFFGGMGADL
jgi:hypothetical protein